MLRLCIHALFSKASLESLPVSRDAVGMSYWRGARGGELWSEKLCIYCANEMCLSEYGAEPSNQGRTGT